MSIKSAPFSFVRFEHPQDSDYSLDIPYSLPAFQEHNIAFQFIVDDDRPTTDAIRLAVADENGVRLENFGFAAIVAYRYRITGLLTYATFDLAFITVDGVSKAYDTTMTPQLVAQALFDDFGIDLLDDYFVLPDNVSVVFAATYAGNPTSFDGAITPVWHQGHAAVTASAISQETFTYALVDTADNVLGYSNLFKVIEEEAFTSQCTYYCNEDAFAFFYPSSIRKNMVRLPIYLTQPQYPKTRNVDRKSDGTKRVLSSFVEKEYTIETEQMPEVFHEAMAVMLSHDTVSIHNVNIREIDVDLVETDNYAPKWELEEGSEQPVPFSKGKGKVKVASYGYTNSNC